GAMSGYFGDRRYRSPWPVVALSALAVTTIVLYLAFGMAEISNGASWWRLLAYVTAASIVACLVWLVAKVGRRRWFAQTRKVSVPIDFLVLRAIEILRSIPAFFLLFAVLGMVTRPSLTYVVLLIAILRAPTIIRYVRAESMKLRDQTFVDAARVIGISNARIIRRHIIPNALGPVLITMAFGMGTAVLLESGLSFLGIGSGLEEVTWGKMLSTARAHFSAWWLAIFPGLAIFLIIASFNRIGDVLSARFQRTVLA
ncbi:MAG: ABC transporter permease, partial [Saprospiraceae bacterium]|nr:ABC transporter permease [Saprospiraceae bacterium]